MLGFLDDALLAVRLIPDVLMEEFRYQAALPGRPGAQWAGGGGHPGLLAAAAALWAWRAIG